MLEEQHLVEEAAVLREGALRPLVAQRPQERREHEDGRREHDAVRRRRGAAVCMAGRAAAASFIGDRFRKPAVRRLLYVCLVHESESCVPRAARYGTQQGHFGFQAHNCVIP